MSIIEDDLSSQLAQRLRVEREARDWSLADLAARSGVSKAALSKIEREEVSPSAAILVRIATAFGLTLAQLVTTDQPENKRLLRRSEQPLWTDPAARYTRRQVFIDPSLNLELVEVSLPPGAVVSMPAMAYVRIRQVAWVLSGRLTIMEGDHRNELRAGDRLDFGPPSDVSYRNEGEQPCRYLIALLRV